MVRQFLKEGPAMKRSDYEAIERYMLACMKDSAHDKDHVYRVLYNAMLIAREETDVDMELLIAACLLHDVGRAEQIADPRLCHAQVGAEKALDFLRGLGWSEARAKHVSDCIRTHRFRKSQPPESIEARILYDADKLDVTGAIGAARTLQYNGALGEPIYTTAEDGSILDGSGAQEPDSFFREYRYKLEKVYDRFLTEAGARLAAGRKQAAEAFYASVLDEVTQSVRAGRESIEAALQ